MAKAWTRDGGCVWITGASSGIGRALAARMAADGWRVAISARRREELDVVAAAYPDHICVYPLDVTDAEAVAATVARIEAEQGGIALAVLNAGTHEPMRAGDFDPAVVRRLVGLNFLSVVDCLAALLPGMRRRGGGQIAVVASVAGYRGLPTAAAYGASKAAVINMAESLRPELAAEGIELQLVNPGFVRTPLTARNRFSMPMLMDVDDAAAALYRGLRRKRFEIIFPRPFCWAMKLFRALPYVLALPLMRRLVPRGGS
jgi:short-subunit dehydrogenase